MCIVLYCEMDRTMHLRVIRAGREGWTGYSSCTLIVEYSCLMPRHLVYLWHSFNGIEASNIVAIFSTFYHTWGSHWKARTPTERWRPYRVSTGLTSSVAWTGSEEANDYFYVMDRTGSEVKGQAWLKIRSVLSSGSVLPSDQSMSMSLPSKLVLRLCWFVSRSQSQNYTSINIVRTGVVYL